MSGPYKRVSSYNLSIAHLYYPNSILLCPELSPDETFDHHCSLQRWEVIERVEVAFNGCKW
jgi:hypothetical protein